RNRVLSEKLRRGVYLIPSLFTAGNIMYGFFSIVSTFNGEYVQTALFVIFAHVLDGVDGYTARLTKTTSQFGIEFDSLADVVSFGMANDKWFSVSQPKEHGSKKTISHLDVGFWHHFD